MKSLLLALFALPVAALAQNTTVAVIPKGVTNFWKAYEAGAQKAGAELGVEVIVRGPRFEKDVDAQIQIVDYFREKKVNAIVITPLHKDQLVAPVEKAIAEGIPVVNTDSGLNSTKTVSFIGSNNLQAGQLGGRTLAELVGPASTGELVLLRYLKGSESTEKREEGGIQQLKALAPKATIIDSYYSGTVLGEAKRACDTLLDEHPNIAGIVAITTISTDGVLKALQQKGLAGKVLVVGAGSSEDALAALRKGEIGGLVVQNPFAMGYQGVKAAVASLKGQPVEKQVFTDVMLVTAKNLDTPAVQALLNP
jgi:ribose transport system substrate-binding protein